MKPDPFIESQEANLSIHIFSVSAAMVGVCLTVIGIFSVIRSFSKVGTVGDDITGIDAVLFLAACLISYVAMKTRDRARRLRLERCADTLFLAGLALMVVICMFLVYVLNQRG